jgi:protein SCO1
MTGVAAVVLVLALAAGAAAEPDRPALLRDVDFAQHLGAAVPLDLGFRDETGRAVALRDYVHDKPVILNLVYYRCPMLCTQVLDGLVSSLRALSFDVGREFEIVTVSFEPTETPALAAAKKDAVLEHYGRPGAAAGWHFLTGDRRATEALTTAVGFRYAYDEALHQYAHATALVLLTPGGRIARYLYGVEYAPRDLRLGLVEASAGRIGSPVDRLLLFCYHYDPATGKYGALVMRVVRLGGVATLLALGGLVLVLRRRDAVAGG